MAVRPTLLVLRALGLGDLLTGIPAFRAVRRAFDDYSMHVAMRATFGPLLRHAVGNVDVLDTSGLHRLDLKDVDVAVNLHGCGPQSHRVLIDTSPKRLIAFHHPDVAGSAHGPPWDASEHEVLRWCRMLSAHGIDADPSDLTIAPLERRVVSGVVVVHPGAASPARRWPPERWGVVAKELVSAGERVVLTGSAEERPIAERVADLAGLRTDAVLAGQTDVMSLAALVANAKLVACGDTGVAHLATAFETPSVVLFGPTSPATWGPPPDRRHAVLWAGRLGDPHGQMPDPGLLEISVADVLAAIERCGAPKGEPQPSSHGRRHGPIVGAEPWSRRTATVSDRRDRA